MPTDKHAPYYIAAYAVSALAFGWMVFDAWRRARRWKRRVDELERNRKP